LAAGRALKDALFQITSAWPNPAFQALYRIADCLDCLFRGQACRAVMFYDSPLLSWIVIGSFPFYIVLSAGVTPVFRRVP
jgi:ABC-type bacteriocin/lantibiotic exporter with double-glycine peptidase domain